MGLRNKVTNYLYYWHTFIFDEYMNHIDISYELLMKYFINRYSFEIFLSKKIKIYFII